MKNLANQFVQKLAEAVTKGNSEGLPLPMVRDPKTGKGSVTLTMVVASFGAAMALLAGKVTKVVGDVDYNNVLWLLGITLSAYLGRKFQGKGRDISIGDVEASSDDSGDKAEGK